MGGLGGWLGDQLCCPVTGTSPKLKPVGADT